MLPSMKAEIPVRHHVNHICCKEVSKKYQTCHHSLHKTEIETPHPEHSERQQTEAGIHRHRPAMDLAVEPAYELVLHTKEMSLLVEIVLVDDGRYRRCIGR